VPWRIVWLSLNGRRRSDSVHRLSLAIFVVVAARLLPHVTVSAQTEQGQARASMTSLNAVGLSAAEMRQIVSAVERVAFDTPESWTDELSARRIDLGASAGLVLRGAHLLCGATGNCQVFVLRRVNGRWVSLFERQAPIAEAFQFGPHATNGIKDFTVVSNTSAESGQRTTYRFDGRFYREP
jgi:hypothetical protein